MADERIRFDDGAAYEKMMGVWSRLVGELFIDWLAVPSALTWIDVGCGNGAFTQLIFDRSDPARVFCVDPSDAQIAYASKRLTGRPVAFVGTDAMALPTEDALFDIAVMALVLFFVPEPARALAEMRRVTKPGGIVAAYLWDFYGGGFPAAALQDEMRAVGITPRLPPSVEVSRLEAMTALWTQAGLEGIETRQISVERTYADFEDYWATSLLSAVIGPQIAALSEPDREQLRSRLRARLPADATGHITVTARANAIKGRVAPGP